MGKNNTQNFDLDWLVIVNPNAGNKKGEKDWPQIQDLLKKAGFTFQVLFTEYKLHAVELTKNSIEKGYKKIIAAGGDGTLNEILNGIVSQKKTAIKEIKLGMIMLGTGNDWGRTFNIPKNYNDAINVIAKGKSFYQDIASVTFSDDNKKKERYFINMAGLGFDGLVAKKTNTMKEKGKGGTFAYIINLLLGLFQYKSVKIKMNIDGLDAFSGKMFSMIVGIGQFNGGGMMQAPNAVPDDGQFEITIFKTVSKFRMLFNIYRLYYGTISHISFVKSFKGKEIKIESIPQGRMLLEADGESFGQGPYEFQIYPKQLQVIIKSINSRN